MSESIAHQGLKEPMGKHVATNTIFMNGNLCRTDWKAQ
jgi:hypothetical protein